MITANGSINATEEATVQLLKDTPAVLSLDKLCEENSFYMSGKKDSEFQSYQK